jgi:hypothetical protein
MPRFQCQRCGTDFLTLRARTAPRCPTCGGLWPKESSATMAKLAEVAMSARRTLNAPRRFNRPSPDFVREAMGRRAEQALQARQSLADGANPAT